MTKAATTIIDGAAKAIDAILDSLERDPTDPAACGLQGRAPEEGR